MAKKPYMFKHKSKGLGIHNWIKSKTAIEPGDKGVQQAILFFKAVIEGSKIAHYPVLGHIFQRLMHIAPAEKKFTSGVALNLNADIAKGAENLAMPIELMKKAVQDATYIAIMHKCFCRTAHSCQDYPRDFGCIFIGPGSKSVVDKGIARKATAEEALAHIDRAVDEGLVGQTLWLEAEQYIWGIKDEDMHRFLEICFCCPCCCTAFKVARNSKIGLKDRLRSAGWKAIIDQEAMEKCGHCQICTQACVLSAVRNENGAVTIDEEICMGCGICATKCPNSSIRLDLVHPQKENLKDYFWQLDLEL